ncbi:reverse transcriptase domain-containing protein, partial [Tanacetum coccineum]
IDPHSFNAESNLIESLLNRDTLIDFSPKFDFLLEEFSGELAHINLILPGIEKADFDLEEEIRLVENLSYDNSYPRPPEELNLEIADTILESLSPYPIPITDSDSLMEEIDLFLASDDLMPPGIENDDYDSEGDIRFLEELLINDSLPLTKNKLSNLDHFFDPSFPRPPPEPPDVEISLIFEPDAPVIKNIDKLNEDECFDVGGVEINVEVDNSFTFVIRTFLPYLTFNVYPNINESPIEIFSSIYSLQGRMNSGIESSYAKRSRGEFAIGEKMIELDFMGPFPSSRGNKYILVAFGIVSKWSISQGCILTNDARVVVKFLKSLFARFGTPRAIISDHGTHFCNDKFAKVMSKYEVTHRLETAYHPQTSGQVEVSNHGLKRILERTVGENRASWSDRLDDALWAFRTAYKTPIGCTPYKLVYGKSCHLPIELENRAYWALKHANFDLKTASDQRKLQLNELNKLRDQAYKNYLIYKERTKKLHDSKIKNHIFNVGDQVLLFNYRLKIFSGKLKTQWSGPFTITGVFPYGTAKLSHSNGSNFKVNCHRLKHYFGGDTPTMVVPDLQTFPKDE